MYKVYFACDSFNMADDRNAPNEYPFDWDDGWGDGFMYGEILRYISPERPDFYWRGYCTGRAFQNGRTELQGRRT